jgi:hypothetical protein
MIFVALLVLGLVVAVSGISGPVPPIQGEVLLDTGELVKLCGIDIDDFNPNEFLQATSGPFPEGRVQIVSVVPGPTAGTICVTVIVLDTDLLPANTIDFDEFLNLIGFDIDSIDELGPSTSQCLGGVGVVVVTAKTQARKTDVVLFDVTLTNSLIAKVTLNAAAVDPNPLLTNGGIVQGAICTLSNGQFEYVCFSSAPTFTVSVRVRAGATANLELKVEALSSGEFNCDDDEKFVEITDKSPLSPDCVDIDQNGKFCINNDNRCFQKAGTCTQNGKRAAEEYDIFPMTYALSYRRVKKSSKKLQNSHENDCGPRFSFIVDDIPQFISTQATFLSQGVVTFFGNATLAANRDFEVKFQTIAVDCDHSSLLVFDEQKLIRFVLPIGPKVTLDLQNRFSSVKF